MRDELMAAKLDDLIQRVLRRRDAYKNLCSPFYEEAFWLFSDVHEALLRLKQLEEAAAKPKQTKKRIASRISDGGW